MKNLLIHIIIIISFIRVESFANNSGGLNKSKTSSDNYSGIEEMKLSMNKLLAWCIIPYDFKNRTPEQRIAMLNDLGFDSYAYDGREKHLNETARELKLAKENGIEIKAVWMWINHRRDKPGKLSDMNEKIFDAVKEAGISTQFWVGISENYFDGLNQDESLSKAVEMIDFLYKKAQKINCKIALYNHGGWFGEPKNQVRIIKQMRDYEIGIVYNFHHAHEQLDHFKSNINLMMPYLWIVNLNGMKKEGPKILTIGAGDLEKDMIRCVLESGFDGEFGILGHTENEDVNEVLKRNLEGLKALGFLE